MNLSFNAAAREKNLGERTKLRIANRGGSLRFRPTDRKAGVNLPKGEKLIQLSGGKGTLPEGFDAPAGKYSLHTDKYGWLVLEAGGKGRGPQVTIG